MASVIVIQSRTNSSRLPGKALLSVAGMPMAVLSALRAGNTGRTVIVVTSDSPSDDVLAQTLSRHQVPCFRGSLDDVLSRFVGALRAYDDETIVFRLTADNVFPDGSFLDELEQDFLARNLHYMCCNGAGSGTPYGMSAEITRLRYLRAAADDATEAFDREHVTPWIIRKFGRTYFRRYLNSGMGHHRCTIDNLDEFLVVAGVFEGITEPVQVPASLLIERLAKADLQPITPKPADKLVLGTAQLGVDYGIANSSGRPDRERSRRLIRTAIVNGVHTIDTARAYGGSEAMIGYALGGGWQDRADIVTKLSPLDGCPGDATPATVKAFVDASFFSSMSALAGQKISTLLLHRSREMNGWGGKLRDRLLAYRAEGLIRKFGVSVQSTEELRTALADREIEHIQMPYNLLDARWEGLVPAIQAAKAERDLTIHVRSVFLQGLLNSRIPRHWVSANVADPSRIWCWLDWICLELERSSVADLCIAFVAGQSWIDGIVIGMETIEQLTDNLSLFQNLPLSLSEMESVRASRPALDESSLNPALWVLR